MRTGLFQKFIFVLLVIEPVVAIASGLGDGQHRTMAAQAALIPFLFTQVVWFQLFSQKFNRFFDLRYHLCFFIFMMAQYLVATYYTMSLATLAIFFIGPALFALLWFVLRKRNLFSQKSLGIFSIVLLGIIAWLTKGLWTSVGLTYEWINQNTFEYPTYTLEPQNLLNLLKIYSYTLLSDRGLVLIWTLINFLLFIILVVTYRMHRRD